MLVQVRCPDCGDMIAVLEGAHPGDLLECPNCAGHALRLTRAGQSWAATLAYHVSCPRCDNILTLPEDVKGGDTIHCCGRQYRLTYEYAAFAAEEPQETQSSGMIAGSRAA